MRYDAAQRGEISMADNVNHPAHYSGDIECIDAIAAATADLKGEEAVCTGNALKYLWRWKKKNGIEDIRKAIWYCNRIIEKSEKTSSVTAEKSETTFPLTAYVPRKTE